MTCSSRSPGSVTALRRWATGRGNADTGILRQPPLHLRILFLPFTRNKRAPGDVAAQLLGLLADGAWTPGVSAFADRNGRFVPAPFVTDARRQADVLRVRQALLSEALGGRPAPARAG